MIQPHLSAYSHLPAMGIADSLNGQLAASQCTIVTAPPGAGKSTFLPLTILQWLQSQGDDQSRILMLEPRRLAARQIAERMAQMIGEPVGQTVGFRVRLESKVSAATRIEVLTEGILTRVLTDNPMLDGVRVVIFDEFHERSLNADLALALTRITQQIIRPDLRILIMSATIDTAALCQQLDASLVESEGRMFPVRIVNAEREPDSMQLTETAVRAIRKAHDEEEGDILVFLPGEAEIRSCQEILGQSLGQTQVYPLYGLLSSDEQRQAIAPSPEGQRKVVLATNIAETSVTIEGVRIVIDTGLCRTMTYNPQTGLSRLETVRISMDMANQRSGRAGRVAPGVCYRLWSMATQHRMAENRQPEILNADLSPALLQIAAWGEASVGDLPWVTLPPRASIVLAQRLLASLNAIDADNRITAHGRQLAALPCHPRIAQMLVSARSKDEKAMACDIAALLDERDPMANIVPFSADIRLRLADIRRWKRISRIADQYRHLAKCGDTEYDPYDAGRLLALAYPERIAHTSDEGNGRYLLAGGGSAKVDTGDELSAHSWLAIANLNAAADGRVFLAAPIDVQDLREMATERDVVMWDSRRHCVIAQHEWRIGQLLLDARPAADLKAIRSLIIDAICQAAPREGLSMFACADDRLSDLQRRLDVVAQWHPELLLPDTSTSAILDNVSEWLPMYFTSADSLDRIDLSEVAWSMLTYEQQQAVDRIAPKHVRMPSGRNARIEYRQGAELPIVRVRLQECFGMADTPRIDNGRHAVLMELLSPGFKPVQLTQDLRNFWKETYFEVRKELRRRYPKHSWPDDPMAAGNNPTVNNRKS
ncbi:MAG: ATP-dependent helicase HrpB [Bacteroidales bacterium]|nr:ATP-dependent helicase HrpB [Candidatus Liminaster caballi]